VVVELRVVDVFVVDVSEVVVVIVFVLVDLKYVVVLEIVVVFVCVVVVVTVVRVSVVTVLLVSVLVVTVPLVVVCVVSVSVSVVKVVSVTLVVVFVVGVEVAVVSVTVVVNTVDVDVMVELVDVFVIVVDVTVVVATAHTPYASWYATTTDTLSATTPAAILGRPDSINCCASTVVTLSTFAVRIRSDTDSIFSPRPKMLYITVTRERGTANHLASDSSSTASARALSHSTSPNSCCAKAAPALTAGELLGVGYAVWSIFLKQ